MGAVCRPAVSGIQKAIADIPPFDRRSLTDPQRTLDWRQSPVFCRNLQMNKTAGAPISADEQQEDLTLTPAASIEKEQVMPTTKRRALILISSARQLPLAEPADVKSISTGFFLVEMAQILKEF